MEARRLEQHGYRAVSRDDVMQAIDAVVRLLNSVDVYRDMIKEEDFKNAIREYIGMPHIALLSALVDSDIESFYRIWHIIADDYRDSYNTSYDIGYVAIQNRIKSLASSFTSINLHAFISSAISDIARRATLADIDPGKGMDKKLMAMSIPHNQRDNNHFLSNLQTNQDHLTTVFAYLRDFDINYTIRN